MKTTCFIVKTFLVIAFLQFAIQVQKSSAAVTFSISPGAISNQYTGYITLQISNLTAGATVELQEFADANSNGIVDSSDIVILQFQVSDGQAATTFSGVTNVNIPFDSNPAAGVITVQLCPAMEGLAHRFVGQHLFVVSSPSGQFTAVTNTFLVTNTSYAQSFTGKVVSNGTNVANAMVLLSGPPSGNGFKLLGGTMTDSSGNFTLNAASGTYQLVPLKYNYVASLATLPVLTLSNGATINTNLTLSNATRMVSGRLADVTNGYPGIPGTLMVAICTNYVVGFGASDTNGNFVLPAIASGAQIGMEQQGLDLLGYIGLNNNTNVDATGGDVSGMTISLPKATAIIYGSIKDNNNNPIAGVRLSGDNSTDGNGIYQGDATTDPNGNYAIGVNAGLWSPSLQNGQNAFVFPNYLFSQGPSWDFNNGGPGTNVVAGDAIQADFSALPTTYYLTGSVKDTNNNPIVGVQVYAWSIIGGASYQSQQDTDSHGNYSLNVANGSWDVNVLCCCDKDSLQNLGNYQCPNSQTVNISNGNGTENFIIQAVGSGIVQPSIGSLRHLPNHQFQFTVDGVANQNYTVQYATALTGGGSGWSSLLVTNSPSSSFTVTDTNASNNVRFYRVLVGP